MNAGDRLGEYVLRERLGAGGFGEVWRAENPELPGAFVALKVAVGPEAVSLLRREARVQHALDHPHIVKTLSLNTLSSPPYLVLEYVPGESLRARLDRRRTLPPAEAAAILLQVLDALEAAHRAGSIHRDIKPGNILLTVDGAVKLTDFGLVKMAETASERVEVSDARVESLSRMATMGTEDYMSPEQRARGDVDGRTDLYACGVVLYEMLAGEVRPIELPIPGLEPGAQAAYSEVVRRCIQRDPRARYASAAEMKTALRSAVEVRRGPVPVPEGLPAAPLPSQVAVPPSPGVPAAVFVAEVAPQVGEPIGGPGGGPGGGGLPTENSRPGAGRGVTALVACAGLLLGFGVLVAFVALAPSRAVSVSESGPIATQGRRTTRPSPVRPVEPSGAEEGADTAPHEVDSAPPCETSEATPQEPTARGMSVNLVGCTLSGRRLTCDVDLTSLDVDRSIELQARDGRLVPLIVAWDEAGNSCCAERVRLANQEGAAVSGFLKAGLPTRLRVTFQQFSPNACTVKLLRVPFRVLLPGRPSPWSRLELSDVTIRR